MNLETFFQMIEALAVVFALGFALVQLRQHRWRQARDAAMELLGSFQTPEFAKALNHMYALPDGLSKTEIEERVGDDLHFVYALTTMYHRGTHFRREISFEQTRARNDRTV